MLNAVSIDERHFADDGTGPKKREDTLSTGLRRYGHFEQSLFDQITTVTAIAGKEQRFVRCKPQGRRTRKKVRRKLALQF